MNFPRSAARSHRTGILVVGVALCASAVTHFATARAFGIPEVANGTPTLVYSGTLFENGLPLRREVDVEVALFADPIAVEGDVPLCATGRLSLTPDASGAFSIALPAQPDVAQRDCVAVVSANPSLFVAVFIDGDPVTYSVNGAQVSRLPLAAVPFAVEAKNAQVAEKASPDDVETLKQQLDVLRARVTALENP